MPLFSRVLLAQMRSLASAPAFLDACRADAHSDARSRSSFGDGTGRVGVAGGSLHWEATGTGAPVPLLHGGNLNRRMWDEQFDSLLHHCPVIRCDARVFGRSGWADRPIGAPDDLAAPLRAHRISRATLIGLSNPEIEAGTAIARERHMPLSTIAFLDTVLDESPPSHERTLALLTKVDAGLSRHTIGEDHDPAPLISVTAEARGLSGRRGFQEIRLCMVELEEHLSVVGESRDPLSAPLPQGSRTLRVLPALLERLIRCQPEVARD